MLKNQNIVNLSGNTCECTCCNQLFLPENSTSLVYEKCCLQHLIFDKI